MFDETMDLFPNLVGVVEHEKDSSSIFESTTLFEDDLGSKLLDEYEQSGESLSTGYLSPSSDIESKDLTVLKTEEQQFERQPAVLTPPPSQTIPIPLQAGKVRVIKVITLSNRQQIDTKNEANDSQGLSKNAIAARENRIRKKKYIQELETKVEVITSENTTLKTNLRRLETVVDDLEAEVKYLRNVLENVDEISSLVKAIRKPRMLQHENMAQDDCRQGDDVSAKNSLKRKREDKDCGSNENNKRLTTSSAASKMTNGSSDSKLGGVCLHVNEGQMSLEFCARCSGSAVETWHTQSR